MSVSSTIIIILLSVGCVQGLIYGGILLRSSENNKLANRILATILFFLSYRLLVQILRLFGLGRYDGWYYVMLDFSWIHGPLLYFYVKAHLTNNFKFKRNDLVHLIPFAIQVAFSIFVRLQNLYWEGTRESLSWLGYWGYVVWMNLSTIYFVASILIILYATKAQRLIKVKNRGETISNGSLNWLKKVLLAFKVYFIVVLCILIVDLIVINKAAFTSYFYFTQFYYYPFFIGISGLTYWLGIEGYRRKDSKYLRAKIPNDELAQLTMIANDLNATMEENKWFKDPELTLGSLAANMKIKPYLLTKCLNTVIQKKFADYINELRVKELQSLLQQPKNKKYTLLSLAFEAGFNSKSSFNRAVKKHLGVSPSELRTSF
ncbi:helix-turn-helix domain-containing protein [Croceitalea sp. MTPC5]|uniref:helix-turn-helix domain-containing protein n=1 Tax=Croceitalea sp. MTPC5 TaxID=3056565 RepID=UPI002B3FBDC9|nr:helix-turn-helix domain-containing protein [Croceitalea sp. MTPC5]